MSQPDTLLQASVSSSTGLKCYGDLTGSIIMVATGGSGTYEYSLNNGPFQSNNTFTNVVGGIYTVNTRDAYGCVKTIFVPINSPGIARFYIMF